MLIKEITISKFKRKIKFLENEKTRTCKFRKKR